MEDVMNSRKNSMIAAANVGDLGAIEDSFMATMQPALATTAQQAYDAIKNLEATGKFPLPLTTATVLVGTFHADTGKFSFSVPTMVVTKVVDPGDPKAKPPRPPIKETTITGKAQINAVQLFLKFMVVNPQGQFTVNAGGVSGTADPGQNQVTVGMGIHTTVPNPDGTIPTMTVFLSSGDASTSIQLQVIRPPIVGAGAFTLPAVPVRLIYAPPPGPQQKDYAEYSDMSSFSSKISTTVSSANSTKTAPAYTTSDFLDKTAALVSSIQSLITAFKDSGIVKEVGSAITLGLNLLSGIVSSNTTSTTDSITTTTEHDIQVTDSSTTTEGTPTGLGPGLGDRFVYLRNVKVAWLLANGELSITVLGSDGIRGFAAQELLSDAATLTSSSTSDAGPITNLDAATIQTLLALDPFVGNPSPGLAQPRFVQNDPASAGGSGTDPNGDSFVVTHDITTTDITTQTNVSTTVTDYKPGWLAALFGTNETTENQLTMTYTSAAQTSTEQKQTATVYFFAAPDDPPYLVGLYFDVLFGTFAFTPGGAELK
jgi:hypothetical protein